MLEERKAAREAEMKQLLENREADFQEEQNRHVYFFFHHDHQRLISHKAIANL